jgi:hypothetical protein
MIDPFHQTLSYSVVIRKANNKRITLTTSIVARIVDVAFFLGHQDDLYSRRLEVVSPFSVLSVKLHDAAHACAPLAMA